MRFVEEIAKFVHQSSYDSEQFTIILPSNRMRKYLQKALVDEFQRPLIAPEITTIDQWMKNVIPQTVIDRTSLLIQLFKVHKEIEKDPVKASFEEFLTWGELLLNDFADIDRYLVDPKDIFKNLADIKEIEQWSFNSTELTEGQKRFMEFWDLLPAYYLRLNKQLETQHLTYGGKGFRILSEQIDFALKGKEKSQFIFAGFNALSPAEVSIIKQLVNMGKAVLFTDADVYYLNKPHHEAGSFIRSYLKDIPPVNSIKNQIANKELTVDIVACVQHTGQVKVMADELSRLSPSELKDTLLLLADESLITTVVKNLPASIGKANISMGIPLKSTAVRTLIDIVFSIQSNQMRFKTTAFYHADVLKFIKHPYIQSIVSEEERQRISALEMRIIGRNQIFITLEGMAGGNRDKILKSDLLYNLLQHLMEPWNSDWKKAMDSLKELSSAIFRKLDDNAAFEKASLEAFYKSIIAFENIDLSDLQDISLKSFRHLFDRQWMTEAVAYHGNPIDGLQITGLLETRGIDFKRIYCLGLNEGKLPPTNPIQTLIPMDLRRFHQMPSPREKQGIFGHHFYRLLHHCEHLFVTYSNADSPMALYEPSRYVLQLEKELARDNNKVELTERIYTLDNESEPEPVSVEKNEVVLKRLDQLLSKSVSASMLRAYINCPLDFYYKYILDFGEAQEIEEELESATFGTLIHETLEELYQPYARFYYEDLNNKKEGLKERTPQPITSLVLDKLIKDFPVVLESKFVKFFNTDKNNFKKGHNYLAFEMARDLTGRFLKNERKFVMSLHVPMTIEYLEFKMELETTLQIKDEVKKVKFVGYADRIDRVGDKYRIIDYKSGKVYDNNVKFMQKAEDISKSYRNSDRKFLIQLTQYVWMFKELFGQQADAGIYSFLDTEANLRALSAGKLNLDEIVADFPNEIAMLLEEIYNTDTPFVHTTAYHSYCKYCE